MPKVLSTLLVIVVLIYALDLHKKVMKSLDFPVFEYHGIEDNNLVKYGQKVIEVEKPNLRLNLHNKYYRVTDQVRLT